MAPRLATRALIVALAVALAGSADARPRSKHAGKRARAKARSAMVAPRPRPLELVAPSRNTAPARTEAERELQRQLDEILGSRWLKSAVNGVYVADAVTGEVLYAYGADRQLNPASNTKLISTATALSELGTDFRYETALLGPQPDADGTVHGDVVFLGSGDPTLRAAHLRELAMSLKDSGVTRIEGGVVISSDDRDALGRPYVRVSVSGGHRNGQQPTVQLSPNSDFFVVDNRGKTGWTKRRRGRLSVGTLRLSGDGPQIKIVVRGLIRRGHRVDVLRPVAHPVLFTGYTLRAALLDAGIEVTGGVIQEKERRAPEAMPAVLAIHESVPLGKLAAMINKPSNNFLADRLILTVGALKYGGERTMDKGVKAMTEWLDGIGISHGSYRLENGSGLSHAIHISPRQIATVLLAGARDEDIARDWLSSLAVGGLDGTLRSRFAGHPVAGYVRGKTGTLSGVSALSGIVSIAPDRAVVFSILTSGFRNRRKQSVREGQARVADVIFDYLRAGYGAELPPPPTAAVVPLSPDDEGEEDEMHEENVLGEVGVEL